MVKVSGAGVIFETNVGNVEVDLGEGFDALTHVNLHAALPITTNRELELVFASGHRVRMFLTPTSLHALREVLEAELSVYTEESSA